MITIRSSNISSEVALICLEATLATRRGVYTISSDGPMIDSASPSGGGLFGAISWPRSRFRLADGLSLEQQMFLPHDGSAVALSWVLRGDAFASAQLVVRPFFSGCGPRSYRDIGFHSEDEGGRLSWLANVRGLLSRAHDIATVDSSRGKNICCSSRSPSSIWKRETGQETPPKSSSPKKDPESAKALSEETE